MPRAWPRTPCATIFDGPLRGPQNKDEWVPTHKGRGKRAPRVKCDIIHLIRVENQQPWNSDMFENACSQLVVIKYVGIATKSIFPSWLESKVHQNAWILGKPAIWQTMLCKYGNPAIQRSLKMSVSNSSSSNMWV